MVSEEGYWGEECVAPLERLSETDADVDVATPSGGKPVLDPRSIDPDAVGRETAERVERVHATDQRFENPKPVARANPDLYDAVVFPGGHGTEWNINQDSHARTLLRELVEREGGGKALAICHAVGLLGFTRASDGSFLAADRDVTGFPDAWEDETVDDDERLPDGRKLPYRVEQEVVAAGANWDAELDSDESVTVDGDLLTVRGPESSAAAATALVEALGLAPT